MSKDYKKELATMERLMNYGLNESAKVSNNKAIIEYSQMGADGRTYGILKEGTKYYIKVAPKKNTTLLAEDFDYIGGFNNRKAFDSYTKASRGLNFQLMSINEDNGSTIPIKSQYSLNESAEWQVAETKEMRSELNRFYQINGYVDNLLNENVHYVNECGCKDCGTQPELGKKDENDPMIKGSKENPEEFQKKYKDGKVNDKNKIASPKGVEGNPFTEKPKVHESHEPMAWSGERKFVHTESDLDTTKGTEIGDTAPWTENVNEGFETTELDDGLPNSEGTGNATDYKEPFENTTKQPMTNEGYIFEVTLDEDGDIDECGDINENSALEKLFAGNGFKGNGALEENELHVFGQHPAYRKVPMTTPEKGGDSKWGRDWNDESTKGEQPYGQQIGHSGDPFEEMVDKITNSVVTVLGKKKD